MGNFATPFEAESFINSNLDELDLPVMVRLEDMKGNVKWYYDLVEDEGGVYRLVDRECESPHLIRVGLQLKTGRPCVPLSLSV